MRVKPKEWLLECEITDHYSQKLLSVKFHSDIVVNLIGTPFDEIMLMYRQMNLHPHIKEDIKKVEEKLKLFER